MASAHHGTSKWTPMRVLEVMHAPAVGFCFCGAALFGVMVLQKPKTLTRKQRHIALALVSGNLATFIAELVYYLTLSVAHSSYQAPRSAVIECLGSILVWGSLCFLLATSESLRWQPYLLAFILEFTFDATSCVLKGRAVASDPRALAPLILDVLRTLSTLALALSWASNGFGRVRETGTDEEGQSLLGDQVNGTSKPNNGTGFGTVSGDNVDSVDGVPLDRNKEIKEKQAKRLEEEGGWIPYLKGFAVFMPYLWPRNNPRIMFFLFIRATNVVQGRILNVLIPRQLGIITDKLVAGTTRMPWPDLALWAFYKWFNGSSGYGLLDSYAQFVIYNQSSARISLMAFNHVMDLSMDFHTNKDSGEVQKAVDQANALNRILELVLFQVSPIVLDVGISIWYVTHLFDSYMAFILLFMGVVYTWNSIHFTSWNRENRRKYGESARAENQVLNETMSNWSTVFHFNRLAYEQKRYGDAVWSTINAWYEFWYTAAGCHAIQDIIMTLGFTGCCAFAISQIIAGEKPVGNLVTFISYWHTLLGPLYVLSYSWKEFTNSLIDAERLLQLINIKPTVVDAPNAKTIILGPGKVEFKDVGFHYDPRKQIIKDVNFVAEGGQTIALVGETGGGKSTMIKLISRAYDVTNGSISIDGQDLRSVTRCSLSDMMGLVPQTPVLFNRSIRDNIRYARLDATDAEIEDACRSAAIHDTIVGFPDGYNSKIGERGVRLSGGQLQRVAIAQVLLRNPKIVLLDEATSAVDSSTEAIIQGAFRKLSVGRTTFVIAHRLSTIREADQILVIDKGEIVERGTHASLLKKGGKYAELWNKQIEGNNGSKMLSKANSLAKDGNQEGESAGAEGEVTGTLLDVSRPDSG